MHRHDFISAQACKHLFGILSRYPLQTGTSGIPSIFERVSCEHIFIQGRAKGGKVNWVKKSHSATGRQCCAITEYASRQRDEEEKKTASSQEIKCIHASLFEKKLLRSSSSSWYVTHHPRQTFKYIFLSTGKKNLDLKTEKKKYQTNKTIAKRKQIYQR